jgi:serine/threonine-protein kinase
VIAGRYRLDRLLGEGGMGSVWAATHSVTGGRVALKFVKGASDSPENRRRFLREARAATLVEHPNVVTIRDVFDHEETPVIVMDLLNGETLAQRMNRKGFLELGEAARIALAVIAAAGAAHEVGLIHRDLKPENVFLAITPAGEVVRVLDFGIAKLVKRPDNAVATAVTQSGAVIGTPAYMAPEQIFGERELDHRVDVWSIGTMLFEMLAGERPVLGDNYGQIAKRLLTERIPSIRDRRPDLPDAIVEVIDRMLARERGDRLADLREAADVLAPYASQPRPSFGPPRARPMLDSDQEGRVVIRALEATEEANDRDSGRQHDVNAATEILPRPPKVGIAPVEIEPSPARDETSVAHVASTTKSHPRARGLVLASFGVVSLIAVVVAVVRASGRPSSPEGATATQPADVAAAREEPARPAVEPMIAPAVEEPKVEQTEPKVDEPKPTAEVKPLDAKGPNRKGVRPVRPTATGSIASAAPATAPEPATAPAAPTAQPTQATAPGLVTKPPF